MYCAPVQRWPLLQQCRPQGVVSKQASSDHRPCLLRIKLELSQSGLQQSDGLTVISLKSQLIDLDVEKHC